jgi:predicted nuclease of predicted toxin-antitoxin system
LRFLVDENLPAAVAEALRAEGHDAVAIVDSPDRGADDDAVWALATRERRILVTSDLGFPHPLGTSWPPGVVLIRLPRRSSRDQVVRGLQGLLSVVPAPDLEGFVTVMESHRVRRRRLSTLGRRR